MTNLSTKRKRFLFLDDDKNFLRDIREVFNELSAGAWEIYTAENHAQALAVMQRQTVDVVVVDVDMPLMDGLQFLRLLGLTRPGQLAVIWTGKPTPESRTAALNGGAALFLEKLISPDGFAAVFAALDALAGSSRQEGFRGLMRRVGLQEVLQFECLGRKSSVLEVFTGDTRGNIYIFEGAIVHAEYGSLQGEVALYSLLGLREGEFNLQPFAEPKQRTIHGQYEYLLMEAARLQDEAQGQPPATSVELPQSAAAQGESSARVSILEILLCSGAGEVLFHEGFQNPEARLALLTQVEQEGSQLASLLRCGQFQRLEAGLQDGRLLCQVQPHMRLLVRAAYGEGASQ